MYKVTIECDQESVKDLISSPKWKVIEMKLVHDPDARIKAVKALRSAGWGQKQLAELFGVTQATISNDERTEEEE